MYSGSSGLDRENEATCSHRLVIYSYLSAMHQPSYIGYPQYPGHPASSTVHVQSGAGGQQVQVIQTQHQQQSFIPHQPQTVVFSQPGHQPPASTVYDAYNTSSSKILGILQVVLGILSITFNVIGMAVNSRLETVMSWATFYVYHNYTFYIAYGIWCAILVSIGHLHWL